MNMIYDIHIPLPEKYGKANVRLYMDFYRDDSRIRKAIDLKMNENQKGLLQEGPNQFMTAYGHIFAKSWDTVNLVGYDNI